MLFKNDNCFNPSMIETLVKCGCTVDNKHAIEKTPTIIEINFKKLKLNLLHQIGKHHDDFEDAA